MLACEVRRPVLPDVPAASRHLPLTPHPPSPVLERYAQWVKLLGGWGPPSLLPSLPQAEVKYDRNDCIWLHDHGWMADLGQESGSHPHLPAISTHSRLKSLNAWGFTFILKDFNMFTCLFVCFFQFHLHICQLH